MAAPYVDGAAILAHVGQDPATADDEEWAQAVADALESAIAHRLAGVTVTGEIEAELIRAARQDGAAGFLDRKAPHGILTMDNIDGSAVRLGRDNLRALEPVFTRYAGPGIG